MSRSCALRDTHHHDSPVDPPQVRNKTLENVSAADSYTRNDAEIINGGATLNIAIARTRIPDGYDAASYLSNLGKQSEEKFQKTGEIKDLEKAIAYCEEAVATASVDNPNRPIILDSLARRLSTRFQTKPEMADLERAIDLGRLALKISSTGYPQRPTFLNGLSARLGQRFRENSLVEDLKEAISLAREAVDTTPTPGASGKCNSLASRQQNLASRLKTMYEHTRDPVYLEESLEWSKRAIEVSPPEYYRAGRLCNLGVRFKLLYDRTGDPKHLEGAIHWGRKALNEVPTWHVDRSNILNHLGVSLSLRYERTDDISDLEEAITMNDESVKATSPTNPLWPIRVSNLCNRWILKWERTGKLDDLQRAISHAERALEATPKDKNETNRAMILNTLSVAILSRYEHTKAMGDLDLAVSCSEQAIADVSPENWLRLGLCTSLSIALTTRYDRAGIPHDLERAIDLGKLAVDITAVGSPDRARFLTNLGMNFGKRFLRFGGTEDLKNAIFYSQGALDAAVSDSARMVCSTNLGNWLATRFDTGKDIGDLDQSVLLVEKASQLIHNNPDSPHRANIQRCLAEKLTKRYALTKNPTDRKRAIRCFVDSIGLLSSPTSDRVGCAVKLANLYANEERWEESCQAIEHAINLLPLLSARSLVQKDQQNSLASYTGMGTRAGAISIQAGRTAASALRLVELSRGIIANHRFETRSDISKLEKEHPDLAREYRRLCDKLDSPQRTALGRYIESNTPSDLSQRQREATELEDLLSEIRRQPNFEKFLVSLDPDEFLANEPSGTIVAINVSDIRCDAFLVRKNDTQSLPLLDLHEPDISEKAGLLKAGDLPVDDMFDLLGWLWDAAAGPILEQLGIHKAPECDSWPRIWWIPTGSLCHLPIHAAGHHKEGSDRTVLDRAVSSYSPSIRSLVFAHQNKSKTAKGTAPAPQKFVFASMQNTPGMAPLPYVESEIKQLQEILPPSITSIQLNEPRRTDVLEALAGCNVFHFAGHGVSDPFDPSNSHLALADSPVTVEDLINQKLHRNPPLLAYLSACSTGNNQVDDLIDEGIHLMGACQLAGFQHVIGSLWSVSDTHCVEVAKKVYATMLEGELSHKSVSLGLHIAARALRGGIVKHVGDDRKARLVGQKKGEILPLQHPRYWAAYIHMGI